MAIAEGAWREVALSDQEYQQILELLGREPTPVELGMFGAMWSEHCGYKHSRPLLKSLPTEGPAVIQGPGENAGAVDIGNGLAAVFKVESHNHPSAVEPYEGAATGVGGIVRDIFTMGARPIALLDLLRFGPLEHDRNRYLFTNVVAGIGGYGNCLGIPTVAGDLFFDDSYSGNPLVNAMCVGIVAHDDIVLSEASGVGNLIMLIGADTGRDGLHGATFASVDDPEASHRGVVQVGNPFLEKSLLEACLELLAAGDVVAMQDLGAAGLTSSLVECASKGGVGAEIDIKKVPRREEGMTAYEVMLSESQERMLLVIEPGDRERIEEIVGRWSLHASVIGKVTDDGLIRVMNDGVVEAEVSSENFIDECPSYVRPAAEPPEAIQAREQDPRELIEDISADDAAGALLELLASPNISSRRPVYEQYDHTILTNTVVPPGAGDAAVLRVKGTEGGIAVSIDCNSRYCYLDPKLGAQHAVAEVTRNVACVGAKPLALTNCLNFGNPEKPGGYYQLSRAVEGIGEAAEALGTPVVSGNVSLYNETGERPIFPTPAVGCVGVLENVRRHATMQWQDGDAIVLLGTPEGSLGGSEYASFALNHSAIGSPHALDLNAERRLQQLLYRLISTGQVTCAHDVAMGGLAAALAKMAVSSGIGANVSFPHDDSDASRLDERWFGECGSLAVVACSKNNVSAIETHAMEGSVQCSILGESGGSALAIDGAKELSITGLSTAWDRTL